MTATNEMRLFSVMIVTASLLLALGNCNVLRLDKALDGVLLADESEEEWNNVNGGNEKSFKAIESQLLLLDQRAHLKLHDERTYDIERIFNFHKRTNVHHFARHGLCRHDDGKIRLYKALKSNICYMRVHFIAQLVHDLCRDKDHHLDNWVNELFDLNGDGNVDHFEKMYYDE